MPGGHSPSQIASGPSSVVVNANGTVTVTMPSSVASAAGAVWDGMLVAASTLTITGNTGITTARGVNFITIQQPTLSAASALTVANAGTLTLDGPPIAGGAGPVTITNPATLWVRAGYVRVDGGVNINLSTILIDDAANILAQRNGVSAQDFRIYNTFTTATNAEWAGFSWSASANVLTIRTNAGSAGGTVRGITVQPVTQILANTAGAPVSVIAGAGSATNAAGGLLTLTGGAGAGTGTGGGLAVGPGAGGASGTAGQMTHPLGTVTVSTPLSITQTWNAAVVFTAFQVNVTSTVSNSGSLLMDLQVGGVSQFSVDKAANIIVSSTGKITFPSGFNFTITTTGSGALTLSNTAGGLLVAANITAPSLVQGLIIKGGSDNNSQINFTNNAYTGQSAERVPVTFHGSTATFAITGTYATQRFTTFGQYTMSGVFTIANVIAVQMLGVLPGTSTHTNSTVLDIPTYATNGTTASALRLAAPTGATGNFAWNVLSGAVGLNSSAGTSGQVLTSAGANALPTWSTVPVATNQRQAAVTNVAWTPAAILTVGASDASYHVSSNVLITTSTTHSFSVTVAYTDESNTPRTLTLSFSQLAGTPVTLITNITGAGPYEGVPVQIRAKAGTTITIASVGTFTAVTYNIEATLVSVA